jgi:integrase
MNDDKLELVPGKGYRVRLRYGKGLRGRFLIATLDLEVAERRAEKLRELASLLARSGRSGQAKLSLEEAAGATSDRQFDGYMKYLDALRNEKAPKREARPALTFRAVGEKWTSGELHREFPDNVEPVGVGSNVLRLEKAIYPVLGDKDIRLITRADCDEVMRRLNEFANKGRRAALEPKTLSRSTRRQYAVLVNRILNLAEIAGYIERNPLPRGWLPKPNPQKRFPILYPSEDLALLSCRAVPLGLRIFYGFLHREAMRRGEAVALQFKDLDLDHETVALDENKTDHPRWWKLSPGVADVLRYWRDHREAGPSDLVFIDENGGELDLNHMADRARVHLEAAGVDRADLFSTGPLKGQFGLHCFRRSFVTRSLALGKNEDWVRQRTGHTSDEILKYRQAAKSVAELSLGELAPLDDAISDFLDGEGWATGGPKVVGAAGFEPATPRPPV